MVRSGVALGAALAALGVPGARPALAEDEGVEQIVSVLREKGLIDDSQQNQILAKHAAAVKKSSGAAAVLSGWELNGDFRLRWDSEYYGHDRSGIDTDDRSRFRYRLRVGARKQFSDSTAIGFRIVSGFNFNRGQDQEFGNNPDFTPDPIQIDRAFLEYALIDSGNGLKSQLIAGKMENPFRWGKGPDTLVVDQDLGFEGATLKTRYDLSENAWLFATGGGYILQEFAGGADPKLFGAQAGMGLRPGRDWELGLRGSTYFFRTLDPSFLDRSKSAGNLDGAFPNSKARIGEVGSYLTYTGLGSWPVTLYAQAVKNFSAESVVVGGLTSGKQDQAYGFGVQMGDSRRFVSIGVGYFQVEANAVLSQYTDPDFFNGVTNSRGYGIYLERVLRDNAFLRIQFYDGDSLRDRGGLAGPFGNSITGHNRRRLETDLVLAF